MAALSPDIHLTTQTLLPWYVNGRIDDADRRLVEAHLAGCADCRAELDFEQELSGTVAGVSVQAERDWARMRRKLQGSVASTPPAGRGRWRFVGGIVAAQAAAVLLFVAVTGRPDQSPEPYRTLSAPQASKATGSAALVMFRPDATESALRAAIAAAKGHIVDGPTDADAYVIRFEGEAGPGIAMLKRHSAVSMAEPIR